MEELKEADKNGISGLRFFVIQMKGVRFFTPNTDYPSGICQSLKGSGRWRRTGAAYDCLVSPEEVHIADPVP